MYQILHWFLTVSNRLFGENLSISTSVAVPMSKSAIWWNVCELCTCPDSLKSRGWGWRVGVSVSDKSSYLNSQCILVPTKACPTLWRLWNIHRTRCLLRFHKVSANGSTALKWKVWSYWPTVITMSNRCSNTSPSPLKSLIARLMGPTCGPCGPHVGPMNFANLGILIII